MPELPEVETVRSGLAKLLVHQPRVERVRLMRADLRFVIPKSLPQRLLGQKITGVRRRAKYILFDMPEVSLLSHLGMTGSWRVTQPGDQGPHDHCFIELSSGETLAYRDPRRFGLLDLVDPGKEAGHPRLKELGVEPLQEQDFSAEFLYAATRKRDVAIKVFIMNQKIVVGIGNIYASEALFRAGIRPAKTAGRLIRVEAERLVAASREVLQAAILAGGSTIRDYCSADGEAGDFQDSHLVYERGGEKCVSCGSTIKSKVLGGRSTYWCSTCQS